MRLSGQCVIKSACCLFVVLLGYKALRRISGMTLTLLFPFFVFYLPTNEAVLLPLVINTWGFENASVTGEGGGGWVSQHSGVNITGPQKVSSNHLMMSEANLKKNE